MIGKSSWGLNTDLLVSSRKSKHLEPYDEIIASCERNISVMNKLLEDIQGDEILIQEFQNTSESASAVLTQLKQLKTGVSKHEWASRLCSSIAELNQQLKDFSMRSLEKPLEAPSYTSFLAKNNVHVHNELQTIIRDLGGRKIARSGTIVNLPSSEGHSFWESRFGVDTIRLEFNTFLTEFEKMMETPLSEEETLLLKHVLDHARTGYVSALRFGEFLKWFSPIGTSVTQMKQLLNQKWFYGFLSAEEASHLLRRQKVGTYLVRFSTLRSGFFSLSYVAKNEEVITLPIESCAPNGVKVYDQGETTFSDLYSLLDQYKSKLLSPLTSILKFDWFHGDLNQKAAEHFLKEKRPGTYLARWSGEADDSYAVSYVDQNSTIQHQIIQQKVTGVLGSDGLVYPTLLEYVRSRRDIWKYNYDMEDIVNFRVLPIKQNLQIQTLIRGPDDTTKGSKGVIPGVAAGHSVTTYPSVYPGCIPICDCFALQYYEDNSFISAIADGCNWGNRPKEAAVKAITAFLRYMDERKVFIHDTKELGHYLLRGFAEAHKEIIQGKDDVWEAGTTTLCGGMLVFLNEGFRPDDPRMLYVCASIGDCKAFHWSVKQKRIMDVTINNRRGLDPKDPGGRLGPYVGNGEPDIRNLKLFFIEPEIDDYIILTTDGVHDNFDCQFLPVTPSQVDQSLKETHWNDIPESDLMVVTENYKLKLISEIIKSSNSPEQICDKIIQHTLANTKAAREFMEANPMANQPVDSLQFPGKLDHATVLVLQVRPQK